MSDPVAIPEELIKAKSKEFDLRMILRLDLSYAKLTTMRGLSSCTSMISLTLSHNKIQKIEDLEALSQLERLDLSFNCLKTINNLRLNLHEERNDSKQVSNSLTFLALEGNLISDINDIFQLKLFTKLRELSFQICSSEFVSSYEHSNPVCSDQNYESYINLAIPQLFMLDKECLAFRESSFRNEIKDYESSDDPNDCDDATGWLNEEKVANLNYRLQKIEWISHSGFKVLRELIESQKELDETIIGMQEFLNECRSMTCP